MARLVARFPRRIDFNQVSRLLERQAHKRLAVTDKWVTSSLFWLRRIPLAGLVQTNAVAGRSFSTGMPIIVDIGREAEYPAVIDGNHRVAEARARGEKTVWAYVGERALGLFDGRIPVGGGMELKA